jgi:hypothetical protein
VRDSNRTTPARIASNGTSNMRGKKCACGIAWPGAIVHHATRLPSATTTIARRGSAMRRWPRRRRATIVAPAATTAPAATRLGQCDHFGVRNRRT